MKRPRGRPVARHLTVTLLLLMVAPLASGDRVAIGDLGWLAGCWVHDGRDPGSVELWLAPTGGLILGVSRIVREGRAISHEFLRVEETGEGSLRLTALPDSQPATSFLLTALEPDQVVFENPEHDFPQRISYRLAGPDRLVGRAEGNDGGQLLGIDFPMTRYDCLAVTSSPDGPG